MIQAELFGPPPICDGPLIVRTGRVSYRGADRFDVTRKSGGEAGHPFAPSWELLRPVLDARQVAKAIVEEAAIRGPRNDPAVHFARRRLAAARAETIEREAWAVYVPGFADEMRASQERWPDAWAELLARSRVVLVCYCQRRERCHRGLLAELLVARGAVDGGEV